MWASAVACARVLVLLVVFVAVRVAPAQQEAVSAVAAQQRLLRLPVEDSDGMDTEVPAGIRDAIGDFKRALATGTDAVVTRLPAEVTAAEAERQLRATMPASTVGKTSDGQEVGRGQQRSTAGLYGGELRLVVRRPAPAVLLVQETFDIACGDDTVLLAYSNASGAWRRDLLWQSKPYREVSGAFGDTYETLLLRPEREGEPLLLVLHGTPWCTSTMSKFAMDVFALGPSSARAVWHGDHGYRRADLDPPLTVRATADGFEVRTSVSASGDRILRRGVMRYAVVDGAVQRVEPLAMNARDTVEEWLQMPRAEAAAFADGGEGSLTWRMFEDFTYEGKGNSAAVPYVTLGAVRACSDASTHFQAALTSEILGDSVVSHRPGPAYFVQLEALPKGYRLHAVTKRAEDACRGPDLMGGR